MMPTSVAKNLLYRAAIPFFSPRCGRHPISDVIGHPLVHSETFVRLLRRHHVLGSATLLSSQNDASMIFTSSPEPLHQAHRDTFFRVASITKTATAVLVLRLAEQKVFSLDDPVHLFFDDSKARNVLKGISVRHLLSHTSGLADPPDLESSLERARPFTDLVQDARLSEPGTVFRYSNLGFGLIGCILEAIFSQPVGNIFLKQLFEPLNMRSTLEGCRLSPETIMPVTRILPYRKGTDLILTSLGASLLTHPDPLRHYGHTAGSMYTDISSLHSLFREIMGIGTGFLSEPSLHEMKKEHASYGSLSPSLSYGLGLLRIQDHSLSDGIIYGHQGFAYGCADGAFWEEKTGNVFIMLNGGCSEARIGRLGLANRDFLHFAYRKEIPEW